MKTSAFIIPFISVLAGASPVQPNVRAEAMGELHSCGYKIGPCPVKYECVPINSECEKNCPGYCYPVALPTTNLPTASLITNTGLPTASLPTATGLPTTNVVDPKPTSAAKRGKQNELFLDSRLPESKVPTLARRDENYGVIKLLSLSNKIASHSLPPASHISSTSQTVYPTVASLHHEKFEDEYNMSLDDEEDPNDIWREKIAYFEKYNLLCGGFRPNSSTSCPQETMICIDAPWTGCGMACDRPGICVEGIMCAGFAGFRCPEDTDVCIDWPNDGCDPKASGRDCAGVCI